MKSSSYSLQRIGNLLVSVWTSFLDGYILPLDVQWNIHFGILYHSFTAHVLTTGLHVSSFILYSSSFPCGFTVFVASRPPLLDVAGPRFSTLGSAPIGRQPVVRPLPTRDGTNPKDLDKHLCFEWYSSPRSQCPRGQNPHLSQTGMWCLCLYTEYTKYH
jgi:hypothetical protein